MVLPCQEIVSSASHSLAESGLLRSTAFPGKAQLSRARERLRQRLAQRGYAVGSPTDWLAEMQSAITVTPVLVHATIQLAILAPIARLAMGLAQQPVVELAECVLHQMQLLRLQKTVGRAALLLLTGAIVVLSWLGSLASSNSATTNPASTPAVGCHAPGPAENPLPPPPPGTLP
jgi:hypothetical protein